jgi:hypothetical protein
MHRRHAQPIGHFPCESLVRRRIDPALGARGA